MLPDIHKNLIDLNAEMANSSEKGCISVIHVVMSLNKILLSSCVYVGTLKFKFNCIDSWTFYSYFKKMNMCCCSSFLNHCHTIVYRLTYLRRIKIPNVRHSYVIRTYVSIHSSYSSIHSSYSSYTEFFMCALKNSKHLHGRPDRLFIRHTYVIHTKAT